MSPIKYGYFGIVWEILNERAVIGVGEIAKKFAKPAKKA
jgi:hypothetical protein